MPSNSGYIGADILIMVYIPRVSLPLWVALGDIVGIYVPLLGISLGKTTYIAVPRGGFYFA